MTFDDKYYVSVIHNLIKLPKETEWVEFKVNNDKPEMIGEYLSALSNSAALWEQEYAYLIYGVKDDTHDIVGTSFIPTCRCGSNNRYSSSCQK